MGQIGRWIDSRSDEERDRIIEHPDPTYDGKEWWDGERDCGCLVGCAVGKDGNWIQGQNEENLGVLYRPSGMDLRTERAGVHFPDLTNRFGAPRMWRVVKARAAKGNRVEVRALAATPTEATPHGR